MKTNRHGVRVRVPPKRARDRMLWKREVFRRHPDGCVSCGSRSDLTCHHIRPKSMHPGLSLDPENGVVLCRGCHDVADNEAFSR